MNSSIKTIKSLSEDDRPREKMIRKGKEALSKTELLAILLGSGSKKMNAIELAQNLLASTKNSIHDLARLSLKELQQFDGIGPAKAVSISAALELGRRRKLEAANEIAVVRDSKSAYRIFEPHLSDLRNEEFWILHLNQKNKVLHKQRLSSGGITGTVVDIRIILKEAIMNGSTSILVAHNHPSGSLQPSKQDIRLTKKLKESAEIMDIRLLDHIIITQTEYTSLRDEGYF